MESVLTQTNKVSLEQLSEVIAKRFKMKVERITPAATLEELGFDSLSQVDLALLLEKKFGTEIPDAELAKINSIGDVLQFFNGESA